MGRLSPRTRCALAAGLAGMALAACGADHSSPPTAHIADGQAAAVARIAPGTQPPPAPAVEGAVLDRRVAAAERSARRGEAAHMRREIARVRRGLDARASHANA